MNAYEVARIAHEVNRAVQKYEQEVLERTNVGINASWEEFSGKQGTISAIISSIGDEKTPEERHEAWLKAKKEEGYSFGKVKDEVKKEHPCFLPYEQLDDVSKLKDYLFNAVVKMFEQKVSTIKVERVEELIDLPLVDYMDYVGNRGVGDLTGIRSNMLDLIQHLNETFSELSTPIMGEKLSNLKTNTEKFKVANSISFLLGKATDRLAIIDDHIQKLSIK